MTTYIDGKAVGVGTIRAEIGVSGVVLHDNTLVGNGNTEPLGVNTENIVSQQTLANTISVLNTAIDAQAGAIAGKQDELTAGEGIKIENNVISATGGGTMVVATPPTEDGSYVLKCVITNGVPTVSWVKE